MTAPGWCPYCQREHTDPVPDRALCEKISRSSLGTPEAVAMRNSVSDEDVARVMERYRELRRGGL